MKSTIYLACLESMEMKAVGWYLDELLEYVIASNRCDELLRYLFSFCVSSFNFTKSLAYFEKSASSAVIFSSNAAISPSMDS